MNEWPALLSLCIVLIKPLAGQFERAMETTVGFYLPLP